MVFIQVVYGDNIPTSPNADLKAKMRRAQVVASRLFQKAIQSRDGDAEILHLPDIGLRGNSHFMFSNPNNVAVADQLELFLQRKGLDGHRK